MIIAVDTETMPIRPGLAAPPLVCVSFATQGAEAELHGHVRGLDELEALLLDPDVTIVGHHIVFDLVVACAERSRMIPIVFAALEANRIRCTKIRETLIAIAQGTMPRDDKGRKGMFTLGTIAKKRCGIDLRKESEEVEAIRLGYGKFRGVPIAQWPEAYRKYATEDASTALAVYYAQAEEADDYAQEGCEDHAVHTEPHEVRAAFALELMRAWGVRTDKAAIDALERELLSQFLKVDDIVRKAGIVRTVGKVDSDDRVVTAARDGSEDMKALKALVIEAYNGNPPMTEPNKRTGKGGGNIATDADTLKDSGHPVLVARAERKGLEKLLSTFIPALRIGQTVALNAGWNVLVTTTRTSCSKPNLQQPPKAGGVRECIVARPGTALVSVDYDMIELKALSYFCESTFGFSAMAEAIRAGVDVHTKFAARMLGISYEEAKTNKERPDVSQARDTAKAFNFGKPGGLADEGFREKAHSDGLDFTIEEVRHFTGLWFEEWPEMREFFAYVKRLTRQGRTALVAPGLGVVLGDRGYCDSCNAHFQVPVAVGAKRALFAVQRECYDPTFRMANGERSPLYGSRMAIFVHDELIPEIPLQMLHPAAYRVAEVMIEQMQPLFPTVPITCTPAAMFRWAKKAKTVHDSNGLLIPWDSPQAAALKAA